jgi:hypothetical protein
VRDQGGPFELFAGVEGLPGNVCSNRLHLTVPDSIADECKATVKLKWSFRYTRSVDISSLLGCAGIDGEYAVIDPDFGCKGASATSSRTDGQGPSGY